MTNVSVPWVKLHPALGLLGVIANALILGNATSLLGQAIVDPQVSALAVVLVSAVLAWMVHTFPDATPAPAANTGSPRGPVGSDVMGLPPTSFKWSPDMAGGPVSPPPPAPEPPPPLAP